METIEVNEGKKSNILMSIKKLIFPCVFLIILGGIIGIVTNTIINQQYNQTEELILSNNNTQKTNTTSFIGANGSNNTINSISKNSTIIENSQLDTTNIKETNTTYPSNNSFFRINNNKTVNSKPLEPKPDNKVPIESHLINPRSDENTLPSKGSEISLPSHIIEAIQSYKPNKSENKEAFYKYNLDSGVCEANLFHCKRNVCNENYKLGDGYFEACNKACLDVYNPCTKGKWLYE